MLRIKNLDVTFHLDQNPQNDRHALNNVSLNFEKGEFVTIIGSNGSGKTTLLNAIAGTIQTDAGIIELDGKQIQKLSDFRRARYVGRVFQDPTLGTIGDMSIEENLSLASLRSKRHSFVWALKKKNRIKYEQMLEQLDLGLENNIRAKMSALSGGQRQSITLLMSTLVNPDILLLDEHTAALDPKTAKNVMQLTEKIVNSLTNTVAIMITHNMSDAVKYGNRLIMMHEGQVLLDVSGDEKNKLSVEDLISYFRKSQDDFPDSSLLL